MEDGGKTQSTYPDSIPHSNADLMATIWWAKKFRKNAGDADCAAWYSLQQTTAKFSVPGDVPICAFSGLLRDC